MAGALNDSAARMLRAYQQAGLWTGHISANPEVRMAQWRNVSAYLYGRGGGMGPSPSSLGLAGIPNDVPPYQPTPIGEPTPPVSPTQARSKVGNWMATYYGGL